MRILSNDYLANIPKYRLGAKGGPSVFAGIFSKFATARGHEWAGLIIETHADNSKNKFKKIAETKKASYFKFSYFRKFNELILRAKKGTSPKIILEPVIEYLRKKIIEIDPDIIFLNGFAISSWILLMAAKESGRPIVMQHAGIWKKELEIYKDFFSAAGFRAMIRMERDITRFADCEIFLNKMSMNVYNREVATVAPDKTVIVPLPVDNLKIRAKKSKKNSYNIGIVARWDRIKNHEAALNLAKEAKRQNLNWSFHAIVKIPKNTDNLKFKKEYNALIKVKRPKGTRMLNKFYQQMDLMILPSHFDVSPFVVIEAAAQGTPTLISPHVGHADLYRAAGAGDWIMDFHDSVKTVRRIKKIIHRPFPRKLITLFKKFHNPQKICDKYLEIFNQYIKK